MAIPDVTNNTQQFIALAGSTPRLMEVDSTGLVSASKDLVVAKLADAGVITLLTTAGNWDANSQYIGTAITGTYEGQYYSDTAYFYYAYSDNSWIRLPRTSGGGAGDMVLANVQSVTGLKTFDTTKLAMKGSSTGVNTFASAIADGTTYTNTLPAKSGTFAMTSDIPAAAPQYFDASVGTGGDYATIELALAANKYILKVLSSIVTSGPITPATKLVLYLTRGVTLRLASTDGSTAGLVNTEIIGEGYSDSGAPNPVSTVQCDRSGNGTMGAFNGCVLTNVIISWYNSTAEAPIVTNSILNRCKLQCHNSARKYIVGSNVTGYNCWIVGGGVSSSDVITGNNITFYNLRATGSFAGSWSTAATNLTVFGLYTVTATAYRFATTVGTYYNASGDITCLPYLIGGTFYNSTIDIGNSNSTLIKCVDCTIQYCTGLTSTTTNIYFLNCSFTVDNLSILTTGTCIVQNCSFAATLTVTISGNYCTISNNNLAGNLTCSGDYNKIIDNTSSSAILLSATAEYNIVRGNKVSVVSLAAGGVYNIVTANMCIVTNNSGSYTNIIKDNL
jgi:hypothetical protein